MNITAYDLAQRFVGMKEVPGVASNPLVVGMLRLDGADIESDEVPWCSAFVNFIAWMLRLPRSKSLAARSWLRIGVPVAPRDAIVGFDVVILQRGVLEQPGPDVIAAPGHVGFFAGLSEDRISVLGGNQKDSVSVESFPAQRLLGIRRLA